MYQSILHLSWVDKLLDNVRTLFVKLFGEQVRVPGTLKIQGDFSPYFDQQIAELSGVDEHNAVQARVVTSPGATSPTAPGKANGATPQLENGLLKPAAQHLINDSASPDASPNITPNSSRPVTPPSHLLSGSNGPRQSRRARKAAREVSRPSSTDAARTKSKPEKGKSKAMRKWDADGTAQEGDDEVLDYSAPAQNGDKNPGAVPDSQMNDVDPESFGTRTKQGQYVLKDLDSKVHSILNQADATKAESKASQGVLGSSLGAISGYFKGIVGGKILTASDLEKPLKAMQEHLIKKNVAREAAVRLTESVEQDLLNARTGNFQSVDARIRAAMTGALQKILTPTSSLDLLRAVDAVTHPINPGRDGPRRPYVISIVGVNGVGKSTNLSKLAFFLLQNDRRVLLAACDTFRSGAVEQLRVHARNLAELATRQRRGHIELFERGYGKDAANIAREAVAYAAREGFDVVLIDTAGRRHNDARLMSSLEKFAQFAKPDKILMVGEALVGSDSVMQARNFNAAFGAKRGLDGFIISKCDTVGDMVGSLVSMVHATGIPVVFLGVGQHYGDLRTLNVGWAVGLLMS